MTASATRSRLWRRNHPDKVKSYEKARYKLTKKRVYDRRKVQKRLGSKLKGKVVDHIDGVRSSSRVRVVSNRSKLAHHRKGDKPYIRKAVRKIYG